MNLTDLFQRLALGELSNLALAEGGVIAEDKQATIVLHANEGLKRLYTRFLLKEDTLYLEQRGFLTNYKLLKKYAQSNFETGTGHSFYINDLGKPFQEDVIRVMEVWDGYGRRIPLNDAGMWMSVFTPQPTVLQVPHPVEGATLALMYQAGHPTLVVESPDEQILELPEFLSKALTALIANQVFSHMNTQESTAKAVEHLRVFETICVEAIEQDLVTTGASTSGIRFEKNGWV